MSYTDEQNRGNNSGMYGHPDGMRNEQENCNHPDRMKTGERDRQDEVGYDRTRGDETSWRSGDGLTGKEERKMEKAEKKMEKAEKKVEKAEEKFAKGYENDGERKLEKAEKKIRKAQEKMDEVADGIDRDIDRTKERLHRAADNLESRIFNDRRHEMNK